MKRITVRVPPTRVIKFVDGFGRRRVFIRGVGSFLESEVKIDNTMQRRLSEFTDGYRFGW